MYSQKIVSSESSTTDVELKTSFKGEKIKFIVSNQFKDLKYPSEFKFILVPKYYNSPNIHLIKSNEENNNLIMGGVLSYFLIHMKEGEEKLSVYAKVKENSKKKVKMYYNDYPFDEIDSITYKTSIKQKLPSNSSPSVDNYLFFEKKEKNSKYVIIAIDIGSTEIISISTSFYELNTNQEVDNIVRSFYIEKNSQISLKRQFPFDILNIISI